MNVKKVKINVNSVEIEHKNIGAEILFSSVALKPLFLHFFLYN